MKNRSHRGAAIVLVSILLTSFSRAQEPAGTGAAPPATAPVASPDPAPAALPTPSMTGPLAALPPAIFDAGPFGKIAVNGILDGLGMWTGNYVAGDDSHEAALSNGQVFIQKPDGWFQFYLQAGAYNIAALGTPFLATDKTLSNLYRAVPVAYPNLQAGCASTSLVESPRRARIGNHRRLGCVRLLFPLWPRSISGGLYREEFGRLRLPDPWSGTGQPGGVDSASRSLLVERKKGVSYETDIVRNGRGGDSVFNSSDGEVAGPAGGGSADRGVPSGGGGFGFGRHGATV